MKYSHQNIPGTSFYSTGYVSVRKCYFVLNLTRGDCKLLVIFIKLLLCKHCQVTEVQPPSKKVMSAAAFWNGLRGQKLKKYSQAGAVLA